MSVRIAYIAIILIWSTTPLAIQWSSEDTPFFALAVRMVIGLVCCWVLLRVQGKRLSIAKQYWPTYLASGLSLFIGMSFVYISIQYLPSGWVSVLHGLIPIVTGVCAYLYLDESSLTKPKIVGMLLGFLGLCFVFTSSFDLDHSAIWGIVSCLIAVIVAGASSVLIKRLNQQANLSGLQVNVGGLIIAVPLFILTWLILSEPLIPNSISLKAALSIAYLGMIATTVGFTLFYYLLKNIEATQVSLIALITPITALLLGSWLNNEPIVANVWLGAVLICGGLLCFEFGGKTNWQALKKYWRSL